MKNRIAPIKFRRDNETKPSAPVFFITEPNPDNTPENKDRPQTDAEE
jgi:hypothetical protein